MGTLVIALATLAFALAASTDVAAQQGGQPGDPMRIVILVDNSQTSFHALPAIRRGLQQLVNGLPPNHELMLVTTGGHMSIRVPPTRDYLDIQEAIGEINFMHRREATRMIGSVQEVYEPLPSHRRAAISDDRCCQFGCRLIRASGSTTRPPMISSLGLRKTGVLVNAILLTSTAPVSSATSHWK